MNLLEIGIGGYEDPTQGGGSLRMWRAYFKKGNIYGLDMYDKTRHNGNRISTFMGSQTDREFLVSVSRATGGFDIVIDDGSHINQDVIQTFTILFPLLSSNGIYVIEDLQTSYWTELHGTKWGGSVDLAASHTSVGFLKRLVDGLNYEEFCLPYYVPTYFDKNITSIHFYHNLVFIYKGSNDEGSNMVSKGTSQQRTTSERRDD